MTPKPQEIFNYLKDFLSEERLRKIEHFAESSSNFVLPVMEDVYQFRNAAAIVRSAEACGFHHIVALEKKNVFSPNLKVSKGAETWVKIEKQAHSLETIKEIQSRGYRVVAVSPEKNAVSLPDFQIQEPVALVFGTEWEGVSEEFLELCDETLSIPMYGFTQSFNVSVAAAIVLYELKQKLLRSDLPYLLSEEKKWELKVRWAVNSIRSGEEIYQAYLKNHQLQP